MTTLDARHHDIAQALAERYELERQIGRGGMATVYLARDRKHNRPVAIKVMHPEFAMTLGPDRFLREIDIAARLEKRSVRTVRRWTILYSICR